MTINDYIIGIGWQYIGKCGCSTNKDKYTNINHKGYEIRINVNGSGNYEIRHMDLVRRAGKGLDHFKEAYKQIIK